MASTHKNGDTSAFEERQETIYRASVQLFSEVGYVAGTTAEIARRVGLTQPALYHYFESKHLFLVFICRRVGERFFSGMKESLNHDGTAYDRVELFVIRHIEAVTQNAAAFQVYVTEARHLPASELNAVRSQEREYVDSFATLIKAAQAEGAFRTDLDSRLLARLLLGAMNWVFNWYRGQPTVRELADSMLSLATKEAP